LLLTLGVYFSKLLYRKHSKDRLMKKSDVISYFGTITEAAKALGLTKSAISQWPAEIPKLRAFEIERLTKGKLKDESIQIV